MDGFKFTTCGLPVAGFAEGAGFGFAGFDVSGVELEGAGAVVDGIFVVFELRMVLGIARSR